MRKEDESPRLDERTSALDETYEVPSIEHDELLEHAPFLERVALALVRDPSEAEDALQDTWIAAIETPPRDPGNLRGWLRTVLRHAAYRQSADKRKSGLFERYVGQETSNVELPRTEHAKVLERVRDEVERLDEPYRTVVLLRYFEPLKPADIAARLERPLNTVNSQLQRALERLRKRMQSVVHEAGAGTGLLLFAAALGMRRPGVTWSGGALTAAALAAVVISTLVWLAGDAPRWEGLERGGDAPRVSDSDEAPRDVAMRPEEASSRLPLLPIPSEDEPEIPAVEDQEEPAPTDQILGVFELRVVDENEAPIEGARVRVRSADLEGPVLSELWPVASDADGRVSIQVSRGHRVTLGSAKRGDWFVGVSIERDGFANPGMLHALLEEALEGVFSVTLQRNPMRIVGMVTDETGAPVERARVFLGTPSIEAWNQRGGRTLFRTPCATGTDADGVYSEDLLPAGRHQIIVNAEGFVQARAWVQGAAADEIAQDFILFRGARLSGRAVRPDGSPSAHANLVVETGTQGHNYERIEAQANADGRFEVQGLRTGASLVIVVDDRDPSLVASTYVDLGRGSPVVWEPTLRNEPGVRLVVRSVDGAPRPGVFVRLRSNHGVSPWIRTKRTDVNGEVDYAPCPDAQFFVAVYTGEESYYLGEAPILRTRGLRRSLDTQLIEIPESDEFGTFRGIVEASMGIPRGSKMWISHPEATSATRVSSLEFFDTSQIFETSVPAGTYEIFLSAEPFGACALGEVEILAGQSFDLEFQLPSAIVVSSAFVNPNPLADSYRISSVHPKQGGVHQQYLTWVIRSGTTPPPPTFELLPGEYLAESLRGDEILWSQRVSVREGSKTAVAVED